MCAGDVAVSDVPFVLNRLPGQRRASVPKVRRNASLGVLVLVLALTLTGCSNQRFVGIRNLDGESLQFFVPLCGEEHLQELRVEDSTDRDDPIVLWRTYAVDGGAAVSTITFGEQPTGYEVEGVGSLSDLLASHGDTPLLVEADTDRSSAIATGFVLSDLPTDGSVQFRDDDTRYLTVSEVTEAQREDCSNGSFPTRAAFAAGIGAAAALVGALAVRLRQSRSANRRSSL
jgi:hypothetical protein